MKALGIILALLFLVSTAFVDLAGANKAHHLASDVASMTSGLDKAMLDALHKSVDMPSTGRLNGGALFGAVGGLAAFVLLVAAFTKKEWVGTLAGIAIGATVVSAAIYPFVQTGPGDGAAPRPMALVAIALAAAGALGAWLAARKKA